MPRRVSAKHTHALLVSNLSQHQLLTEAFQVYASQLPSPMYAGVWGEDKQDVT